METIPKLIHWYHSIVFMLVMGVIMGVVVYFGGDNNGILLDHIIEDSEKVENIDLFKSCDFFSGNWVYDNISRPLYKEQECSYLTDAYACEKFGRKELKYQFWRWQPHGCDLPRFNGTALLEKLRDKRVVFVGDSLGKNHWVSLLCLIDSWILEPSHKVAEWHDSLITFKASEYNVSIDFYWEPLLVESNCDNPIIHRESDRIMKIESIEKHAKQWIDADMLIFDSYTWWLESNMTLLWGSFENPDRTYVESGKVRRYEMALKTWSDWLESHLNRTKTRIIFTSLSSQHYNGEDWGKAMGENCFNETEPILKAAYWGDATHKELMRTVESAVQDLKDKSFKIEILNITQLSEYRKDGHPTKYKRHWTPVTEDELANPVKYADCAHWCLPGVPDVWNEILYAYILYII
ncbi:protein trichome birefringence-like 34 [Rutidosis leptorrhynchoides]|uniref:protein trichome birefringence-like 34 n=1 Tax=Rutidosis leptorrhynchoides TaxID=125765 RepID=UPI003A98D4C5